MTTKSMNEKRDAQAESYSTYKEGEDLTDLALVALNQSVGFKAGWDAAVREMEIRASDAFDEKKIKAYCYQDQWALDCDCCGGLMEDTKARIRGARWQHIQDFVLINNLKEKIELKNSELGETHQIVHMLNENIEELKKEINKVREQNKIMRDALEFYANKKNWSQKPGDPYELQDCICDSDVDEEEFGNGGRRAREAINESSIR